MGMLEKYYSINQAAGLAINIQKDGSALIDGCQVTVSNNQLSFEKKETAFGIEEIRKRFGSGLPVALNLRGRGVLHKRIDKVGEISQANFSAVLPNAVMAEFYVQHFTSGDYSFVTLIRKTDADKWIKSVQEAGLVPMMLSLGPFPAEHIFPQLNIYDEDIVFDGHMISRDNEKNWTGYRYEEGGSAPFILKIENEQIDQRLVIPYAAVFQLVLAQNLDPVLTDADHLNAAFAEAAEDRKFKANVFMILVLFFVLLLANYAVLSSLNASNVRLSEVVSRTARNSGDLKAVNDIVRKKEALLLHLGWTGEQHKSVMADHIAAMMPRELTLKLMSFSTPDANGARRIDTLRFTDGQIRINGISPQIIPVNEWIARLKTYKWIKNVRLDSYSYNNELDTGVFSITLNY